MKKYLTLALCMVLVVTMFAVVGCGKKTAENLAEKAIEKATNSQVDVDVSNNTVKFNTNGGTFESGDKVSLPAGFPSDIFVIDGTIKTATKMTQNEYYTVSVETAKSVTAADAEYQQELKKDGWEITATYNISASSTIAAQKADRTLSVSISESEGKTLVILGTSKINQ